MNSISHVGLVLFCLFSSNAISCSDSEVEQLQEGRESALLSIDPQFALMLAVQRENTEATTALLESKVNPNWQNEEDGSTPLRLAAFQQAEDTIQLLLDHGACVNLVSRGVDRVTATGETITDKGTTVIEETEAALIHCSVERRRKVLSMLLRHTCRFVCAEKHCHRTPTESIQGLQAGNEPARANQLKMAFQEAAKSVDDISPRNVPGAGKTSFLQPPSPRWDKRFNSI